MPALPGNQFEKNMLNQLMKERNLLNVTFVMPALPENQFEATCWISSWRKETFKQQKVHANVFILHELDCKDLSVVMVAESICQADFLHELIPCVLALHRNLTWKILHKCTDSFKFIFLIQINWFYQFIFRIFEECIINHINVILSVSLQINAV